MFQSNQCFQAIEFVDRHVSEKLALNLIFVKLSSQNISFMLPYFDLRKQKQKKKNMRGFHHATIRSHSFHSFHGVHKERLAQ